MVQETKTQDKVEREYIIPLKREFLKCPRHERARIAVRTIKRFLARHMKIRDRDLDKIKLDPYLNNEIWFRGKMNPLHKVKVKAVKSGDSVFVDFADAPDHVKFTKAKNEKRHKPSEKPTKTEVKEEDSSNKTEEDKKEEKEKEQAVAEANEKQAEQKAKEQKHTAEMKDKNMPQQRKVLSRH